MATSKLPNSQAPASQASDPPPPAPPPPSPATDDERFPCWKNNLSTTVPPHPSQLDRPPPFIDTTIALTGGIVTGLLHDLRDLSRVVLQPGLTLKVCNNFNEGLSFYDAEYQAGRVSITPRQRWHSLSGAFIGSQVRVPQPPIPDYIASTAPTPDIALARKKHAEAAKKTAAEKEASKRKAARRLLAASSNTRDAPNNTQAAGMQAIRQGSPISVSDSPGSSDIEDWSFDSDAFETSPTHKKKAAPLKGKNPEPSANPPAGDVFLNAGAPPSSQPAGNKDRAAKTTSTKSFPPLKGPLPRPAPFSNTTQATATISGSTAAISTASGAGETSKASVKRPRYVKLRLDKEKEERLFHLLNSTTTFPSSVGDDVLASAPALKKARIMTSGGGSNDDHLHLLGWIGTPQSAPPLLDDRNIAGPSGSGVSSNGSQGAPASESVVGPSSGPQAAGLNVPSGSKRAFAKSKRNV